MSWQTRITLALIPALFSLFLALPPTPALAAEFSVRPSIAISEEYSDNVNQEQDRRSEFTTRVNPGLAMTHETRYWDAGLTYGFEYLHYAQGNKKGSDDSFTQNDTRHTLNARGLARIVPNLFFLEIQNDYRRADLNLLRASQAPATGEPGEDEPADAEPAPDAPEQERADVTGRERESSDRNVFSVSPYFAFQPTAASTLRTGYRYTNTWFKEEGVENTHLHEAFLDGGYDLAARLGLDAGFFSAWERVNDASPAPDRDEQSGSAREDRYTAYLGARYAYAQGSRVFARFGTTWRRQPGRSDSRDPYWDAGITHAFAAMTAAFTTRVQYTPDPLLDKSRREITNSASLTRPYARGATVLTAAYTRFNEPDEDKIGAGIALTHELSQRLTGTAGLRFDRRTEDRAVAGNDQEEHLENRVKEWQARLGLSYLLGRDFTAGLNYLYTDSSSNDPLSDDTYQENRVTLEVRKTF